MTEASAAAVAFGKSTRRGAGATIPQFGETNSRVINAINEMYAEAAVIFGRWIGVTDKTAKRKLNLERGLSVEELGKLIRSDQGFQVVAAIMGDAKPKWWRIMVPLMDAAEAREMQMIARRKLEKTIESAVDADKHLAAAISRAEALQDQDHVSVQLDALRSMGRVSNRAVAQKYRR